MPRYLFTGPSAMVLHGLSHGVNATLHGKHGQPDGSTVVAQPGDEISTRRPYLHAHMQQLEDDTPKRARKTADPDTHEQQEQS